MFIIQRFTIFTKFVVGTLLSATYVIFPPIQHCFFKLIKDIDSHINYKNGVFEDDESVCGKVQRSRQNSCSVAQEDGGNDGPDGPEETNGFINVSKPESDEDNDDKST
jgi:hypothetical protein